MSVRRTMIEIEIRAKLKNIDTTRAELEAMGAKRVSQAKQTDLVFGRSEDLDSDNKIIEGHFSARIRQTGGTAQIDFKEIRRTGAGHEYSIQIESADEGVGFLEKLGFEKAFEIAKEREIYKIYDFEISLDKVDRLGGFIEIEHFAHEISKKEEALRECRELLKQIDPFAKVEPKKYGDLMQELINEKNT